jgi:AAA domain
MQEFNMEDYVPGVKKILLIGTEGTGKTRFIKSLPKPICVCSFDKGIATLAGESGITSFVFMDEDRYHPKAWAEFKQFYSKLKSGQIKHKHKDGREEAFKSFAIDSITSLSKFIIDHCNYVNGTIDAKVVGFTPYTQTKSALQDVVTSGVLVAEHFLCTALIEAEKDEITGQLFFRPSTEGKFREEAGQWFDVVGYMNAETNALTKQPRFTMDLLGDKSKRAKIRLPSLGDGSLLLIEDPSYDKLVKLAATHKSVNPTQHQKENK